MSTPDPSRLTHDWSAAGPHAFRRPRRVLLQDETLREGLQSPAVRDPPEAMKVRLLHLMDDLGIDSVSLGIPAAGPRQRSDAERLCREIGDAGLGIRPNLGGRTVISDVQAIADVQQTTSVPIEACLFIGSSPVRQLVEEWDLDEMVRRTRDAVTFAVGAGLGVTYITEDTTRSAPGTLRALFACALESGARRLCLCDTVGVAVPAATMNLVAWVRGLLREFDADVGLDWHGHNDRGLGMANALAAIEAGADRIHATALGLGERVGNTEMEVLLANLKLLGLRDDDLTPLPEYAALVAEATGVPIPARAPVVGRDAFRTATGVHSAAVIKARRKGDEWLADRVYSAVPADWVGRRQEIGVGHVSGASNVRQFLEQHGIAADDTLVEALLARVKESGRVLDERELLELVREHEEVPGE